MSEAMRLADFLGFEVVYLDGFAYIQEQGEQGPGITRDATLEERTLWTELTRLAAVEQELEALKREELKLHQSLAQAVSHAEQGWARYENANRISNGLQQEFEALKRAISDAEPVMIYHGDCTIDCGEHGHHHVEMLKMIPAGSPLYTLKGIK